MIIVSVLIVILFFVANKEEEIIIPKESIRFRIIPNSNSIKDLAIKEKVKDNLNREVNLLLKNDNIYDARKNIIKNKGKIELMVNETFKENSYNKPFKVKYGNNYFPEKTYKGVKYESGNYESLVVEIGEAKGDNFWCVLFPPLCMMEQEKNSSEKEYKFFISEIIDKYF